MKTLLKASAIAAFAGATVAATPSLESEMLWNVDRSHTTVGFTVKHFFTPVTGQFDDFEATVNFDPANPEAAQIDVKIAVASVNTNNEKRDAHLQSADFFDAEKFPYITFTSTSVRPVSDGSYVATGDLTIRDVTRTIELPFQLLGVQPLEGEMSEMFGGITEVASFSGGTTIQRNDYGVGTGSWAATLVVGGDVDIDIAVEVNR